MNYISYYASLIPPVLVDLYGPFKIHSYGVCILLALGLYVWLLGRDVWRGSLSRDALFSLVSYCVLVGMAGGRFLYLLLEFHELENIGDIFAFWQGGFSVLGSLVAVVVFLILYARRQCIPLMPLLDLAAFYAPLLQGFSRLGCFFAGCCYGTVCHGWQALTYVHALQADFLPQSVHPTQLYSMILLLLCFLFLVVIRGLYGYRPGRFIGLYLICAGFERCIVDFWRGDRVFLATNELLSVYQLVALGIAMCGFLLLVMTHYVWHKEGYEYL